MKKMAFFYLFLLIPFNFLFLGSVESEEVSPYAPVTKEEIYNQKTIPIYEYEIVKSYPHSRERYTEGLVLNEGIIYESSGLYGHSKIFKYELTTGKHLQEASLESRYFGEGITVLGSKVYYITYVTNKGFIFDKESLKPLGTFSYPTQGWGLTNDEMHLILSDGSAALHFFNPKTFKEIKTILVSDGKKNIGFLNELEYFDGKIYANIYPTNYIAEISPESGKIVGWIDLSGLNPDPKSLKFPLVLNGIAFNPKTKNLLVTGKEWPQIYEIKLKPRTQKTSTPSTP